MGTLGGKVLKQLHAQLLSLIVLQFVLILNNFLLLALELQFISF